MARVVGVRTRPSDRLRRACAAFGLVIDHAPRGAAPADADALRRALATPDGRATLLVGPSGAGKSTVLRAAASRLRRRRAVVVDAADVWRRLALNNRPIIDLFAEPLEETLRTLAIAGLGEPMVWARAPRELSDGERARFTLACAMAKLASGSSPAAGRWLIVDELASPLDIHTARSVCRALSRWARTVPGVRVLCATVRDGLTPWLEPASVVRLELPGALDKARAGPA